jgi:hypothetical protein
MQKALDIIKRIEYNFASLISYELFNEQVGV